MTEALPIPEVFQVRKNKILSELSIPDAEYTDLSPKGSVDEGIRDLIGDINALPGLVTTSSCAGRISVFMEGRKKQRQQNQQESERQFVPSGGKGSGKWLFVSHDPFKNSPADGDRKSLHEIFGMVEGDGKMPTNKALRLVRFSFEPMILHIMTATLHHAQPVLSAASSSGFRESGLQSLNCLQNTPDSSSPIVAVRASGLALESIIGYCEEDTDHNSSPDTEPIIRSLVSEEYLQMLIAISNERFAVNSERKERFRA
ncbi:tRNA wybutosine-synthesizing protein, partial [Aspergillus sclerotialis]